MKIIEVSKDVSIESYLEKFNYIDMDVLKYDHLNYDEFKVDNVFEPEDIGCVVFVDMFDMNYLKYVTVKRLLGIVDHQILWINTKEQIQELDDLGFNEVDRVIVSIGNEQSFDLAFMKCYHFYMIEKLNVTEQQTIRKTMKSMLGFLGEGILILDANEKIIFCNQRAEEISGHSYIESMYKPIWEVFPFVDNTTREPINDVFKELTAEKPSIGLPYNTVLVDDEDNPRFMSANISYLYKSLLKGYFVIVRDITKIKKTENDFRRISKAVEYSPTSVVITEKTGGIVYVNPYFEELTGYSFDEIEGQNPNILKSGYTSDGEYKELWETISKGNVWKGKFKNLKKNGDYYWERVFIGPIYNDHSEIIQYVAVKQEITNEINLTKQMENERNLFYLLIESAPIGLVLYNKQDGFIKVNQRANKIFENMGSDINQPMIFKSSKSETSIIEVLEDVLHSQESISNLELEFIDDSKAKHWLRIGAVPLVFKGGGHTLLALDDITATKTLERHLEVARDEAKEADKAKSNFLANMSHEIRTPINGIIGMTEITLSNSNLDKEDEANLRMVQYSSRNLLKIINDILDLSKLEAGKIDVETISFDIDRLLFNTKKSFEGKANAKELDFDIVKVGKLDELLLGDPFRLQQILTNLINNAIKFTSEGEVKVTVEISEDIRSEATASILKFSVKDTGIGISKKDQKSLFKRFNQVDNTITRKYGGTGLGLAITMSLIKLLGGTIDVESDKNIGSTFIVELPFIHAGTEVNLLVTDPVEMPSKEKGLDILVVEDDRINQKITTSFLQEYGQIIDLAVDGQQAIEFAKRKTYDVIFMDIQLPIKDGVTAMDEIRDIYEENELYTPIIAVTANALKGDREKYLYRGFDYYISKPFAKETLAIGMSKTLTRHYLRTKKKYYEQSLPELYQMLIDLQNKARIFYNEEKYKSSLSSLAKMREIAKALSIGGLAKVIMKLQFDLRKDKYDTFDDKYTEIVDMLRLVKMEDW